MSLTVQHVLSQLGLSRLRSLADTTITSEQPAVGGLDVHVIRSSSVGDDDDLRQVGVSLAALLQLLRRCTNWNELLSVDASLSDAVARLTEHAFTGGTMRYGVQTETSVERLTQLLTVTDSCVTGHVRVMTAPSCINELQVDVAEDSDMYVSVVDDNVECSAAAADVDVDEQRCDDVTRCHDDQRQQQQQPVSQTDSDVAHLSQTDSDSGDDVLSQRPSQTDTADKVVSQQPSQSDSDSDKVSQTVTADSGNDVLSQTVTADSDSDVAHLSQTVTADSGNDVLSQTVTADKVVSQQPSQSDSDSDKVSQTVTADSRDDVVSHRPSQTDAVDSGSDVTQLSHTVTADSGDDVVSQRPSQTDAVDSGSDVTQPSQTDTDDVRQLNIADTSFDVHVNSHEPEGP